MHLAYKIKEPDTTISYKFYRSVFLKYFPMLLFKKPRVDTCKTCDALDLKKKNNSAQNNNAQPHLVRQNLNHTTARSMLLLKLSKVMLQKVHYPEVKHVLLLWIYKRSTHCSNCPILACIIVIIL